MNTTNRANAASFDDAPSRGARIGRWAGILAGGMLALVISLSLLQ